jgi:hypothetical protein
LPAGQDERLDEHLHGGDDLQHQQHGKDQPGLRDRHVPDLPEQAGPVQLGGLVQFARNVLQRGQVDQRRSAHVHPGGGDHHRDHREADEAGSRGQRPLRGRQVQYVQDVIEQPVGRVVEVQEQRQRRDGRQHHRQVHQAAQVALGVPQLVQQDRGEERQRVAEDQGQQGELDRVPPGGPELRVIEDTPVVLQAHPTGFRYAGGGIEMLPLEAHHDLPDHRVPGEDREAHHRADQERPGHGVASGGRDQPWAGPATAAQPASGAAPPGPGAGTRRGWARASTVTSG